MHAFTTEDLSPAKGEYIHEVHGHYPFVGSASDNPEGCQNEHIYLVPTWGPSTDNAPTNFSLAYSMTSQTKWLPEMDTCTRIGQKDGTSGFYSDEKPPGWQLYLTTVRERDNNNFITKVHLHRGEPDPKEYPESLYLKG
ncbi:hypothetical protein H0H92_000469, partial [Tricholoma furcatifolium]